MLVVETAGEHFRLESGDAARLKINHRNHLLSDKAFARVVLRDLCARLHDAEFAKVNAKFVGGLSCPFERSGVEDRADPEVNF